MLSVIMLSVVMLSVIMLSVVMLSAIMLSVVMLSVVMLSVAMLSVMAPQYRMYSSALVYFFTIVIYGHKMFTALTSYPSSPPSLWITLLMFKRRGTRKDVQQNVLQT
jgi:hypothetical protein